MSMGVTDPKKVAEALAAMTEGTVDTFHPVEGAYVCLWGGWEGQFIELYPKDTVLTLTPGGAEFETRAKAAGPGSTHINLEVSATGEEIIQLAKRYGLKHHFRPDHGGPLHEIWFGEELMVELVTSDLNSL